MTKRKARTEYPDRRNRSGTQRPLNTDTWQGRARPGQVRCRSDYKDLDDGVIVELVLPGNAKMQVQRQGYNIVVTLNEQSATFALPDATRAVEEAEQEVHARRRWPLRYKEGNKT